MSWADIERGVAGYYAGKLREHGPTPSGVDWNSPESQATRFEQLMRVVPLGRRVSVLDYGCGYGAFGEYLERAGADVAYSGYDVAPEMVEAARERFRDRDGATFSTDRAALSPADVTVSSGIFNVRLDTPLERWREYTLETIRDMASLSRSALAFNMLTSYSDPDRMVDRLYYGDPCEYFAWCKRNLSRNVALLHDYGLYEFTILVRLDA